MQYWVAAEQAISGPDIHSWKPSLLFMGQDISTYQAMDRNALSATQQQQVCNVESVSQYSAPIVWQDS